MCSFYVYCEWKCLIDSIALPVFGRKKTFLKTILLERKIPKIIILSEICTLGSWQDVGAMQCVGISKSAGNLLSGVLSVKTLYGLVASSFAIFLTGYRSAHFPASLSTANNLILCTCNFVAVCSFSLYINCHWIIAKFSHIFSYCSLLPVYSGSAPPRRQRNPRITKHWVGVGWGG